jgi:hypothetical protein
MKMNCQKIPLSLAVFSAMLAGSGKGENANSNGTKKMSSAQPEMEFKARGNSDLDHRAPRRYKDEVVATFDLQPVKMRFNLPSFPCLVTENNISYYNGWTETYEEELFASFGAFWNANIFVVNTKFEYHPFTIGREEGVSLSPDAPERENRKGIFQSWPQEPNREEGYNDAALGHMILRTFYQKTEKTLVQIYLSGFTNSQHPEKELVALARSWLKAPALKLETGSQAKSYGYDPTQRAYLLDNMENKEKSVVGFEIAASESSPLVNPAFLINNWGTKEAVLTLNGSAIEPGGDFRFGYYKTLEIDDGREWKDVLLVWLKKSADEVTRINIQSKDFDPKE